MTKRVNNDEHSVDAQKKLQIVELREELDEWEIELYSQVELGELSHSQADSIWGYLVRSYLKSVEPLLRRSELEGSHHIYKEVELGTVWVEPPENPFGGSGFGKRDITISGEYPDAKGYTINGVMAVIENKRLGAQWDVQIRDPNSPKRRQTRTISNVAPISYDVLETAVRHVDDWLQVNGIGVELGTPEKDEPEMNPV